MIRFVAVYISGAPQHGTGKPSAFGDSKCPRRFVNSLDMRLFFANRGSKRAS
ncbi:MAG: hypothetical protein ACYDHN_13895 [Solirubrobacteraceae bacterium]